MDFDENFEFTVTDAKLEFEDPPEVDRVVLETGAVPKGRITIKPRKEVEKETVVDGMPGTTTEEEMYEATELPENIQNVVKQAQDGDITCVATVGMNEDDYTFILDEHIETLEARLIQDDRGDE